MASEKKKFEQFLISIFSNFKINCRNNVIKELSSQLSMELIQQLLNSKNNTSYLQKYKTKELIDLITGITNKGIHKREHVIISNIISVLLHRYKTYESVINNNPEKTSSKIIDDILYPSKLITSVAGTNIFTIVNWNQLKIEIKDKEPNCIVFKKIINGIPSNHKIIQKNLDDLHLGLETRNILKTFGYLDLRESYNHPQKKKDQVFRLNRSLKEFFKIPSRKNPFFWKKKKLFTHITITAYDENNIPVLPFYN